MVSSLGKKTTLSMIQVTNEYDFGEEENQGGLQMHGLLFCMHLIKPS